MKRPILIAGNWKMNGSASKIDEFSRELTENTASIESRLALCVPYVYVARLAERLAETEIACGAQDVSHQVDPGAYTGDVSADMLADAGARSVIVGHSERRAMHNETDELVAAKANAATEAGLMPIVCIGESLEQREADETETVLTRQIKALLDGCSRQTRERMVIAYEPIWAIGTGRSATPEQAQSVHALIRSYIADFDAALADSLLLLYGGSVKPDNASSLFAGEDVDGALVGGASLEADSFIGIARAAG